MNMFIFDLHHVARQNLSHFQHFHASCGCLQKLHIQQVLTLFGYALKFCLRPQKTAYLCATLADTGLCLAKVCVRPAQITKFHLP